MNKPIQPSLSGLRIFSSIFFSFEKAGFKVHPTPTCRDPNHVTIELPNPVTKDIADKFNNAFKR